MMSSTRVNRGTEIRKLPPSHIQELSSILEYGESWKRLMAIIPCKLEKDCFMCHTHQSNLPKYHTGHFKQIEAGSTMCKRNCAEILLDEWGTSGRVRPSAGHLLHLLTRAGLYRAADYVAVEMLGEPRPERPHTGPAAPVHAAPTRRDVEPIDERLREVLDARLRQQKEIIRERSLRELRDNNSPTVSTAVVHPQPHVPPRIVVTELPAQTPSTFSVPLVMELEKSDAGLPHFDILLSDKNNENRNSSAVVDVGTLLEDSATTSSTFDSSSENISKARTAPTGGDGTRSTSNLPDLNFLLSLEDASTGDAALPSFPYEDLARTTGGFDERLLREGGRFLGGGAFGSVFMAVGLLAGGPVAVKRLRAAEGDEGDLVADQFRNEVETWSCCRHENLLALLGRSADGPAPCLVYEYAAGGSLAEQLRPGAAPPLPWRARARVALGAGRALAHLHAVGLVHRDVKSANVLLDGAGRALLCDRGPAGGGGGAAFGTAAYMAPEAHAGHVSARLDVFAFGVMLLELLTGLPPVDDQRGDIVTIVENQCVGKSVGSLLDASAGTWKIDGVDYSERLATIAFDCIEYDRNSRPGMDTVVGLLMEIVDSLDD